MSKDMATPRCAVFFLGILQRIQHQLGSRIATGMKVDLPTHPVCQLDRLEQSFFVHFGYAVIMRTALVRLLEPSRLVGHPSIDEDFQRAEFDPFTAETCNHRPAAHEFQTFFHRLGGHVRAHHRADQALAAL